MTTILDWENKDLLNADFVKNIRSEFKKMQDAYEEWVAEHLKLAGDFKEILKWVTLYFSGNVSSVAFIAMVSKNLIINYNQRIITRRNESNRRISKL